MEIEFLGTGTSTGIPQIRCKCKTCTSIDPKDKRLRASAIIRTKGQSLLIDCGPDFREQMLRASDEKIDALLLTHSHYDHVGGIDDLRPYCLGPFPIYAQKNVLTDLKNRIPYCFSNNPYPGVPSFELHEIDSTPFMIADVEIEPLEIMHYKLSILGYKIGNMAYITDANYISDTTISKIEGIDLLIINSLRFKHHISHFSFSESLEMISRIKPKKALLIHMSHDMGLSSETSKLLPPNVEFAYDGLILHI